MITAMLRAIRSDTAMRNDDIVILFRNTKIELTVNFCKNVKSCNVVMKQKPWEHHKTGVIVLKIKK